MRTTTSAEAGRSRGALLVALAVGVLLRLLLLLHPGLWYDEATTGLLGLSVLQGELPVYFFGQSFMGALDGYLAAPVFWALGVSARTLTLLPVLLALAGLALTVRLARDAFGPRAALLTAVLLAVPPDFLLFWSQEARGHYPLTMVLGTLALLLAVRAPTAQAGRATLLFALLGGTLGLAFWINFLVLVYVPAVAVLLLRRGLRPLVPRLLAALPAFVLGSLPHWLYGVPHGTAVPPAGRPVGLSAVLTHLGLFAEIGWPIVAGVPEALRGGLVGVGLAAALGALYLTAGFAALGATRRVVAPGGAVGLSLVVLVLTNVGVAATTQYGRGLGDRDPHYLLPLYTALPPLLGRFLAGLPRRRMLASTAVILALQAAGVLDGTFRNLRPAVAASSRAGLAAQREAVETLERAGLDRLYAADAGSRVLTFLSAERVIFSDPYEEIRPRFARAVDGAPRSAWWTRRRTRDLEAHFAALGLRFAFHPVGSIGGAYSGFTLMAPPVRELDPSTLRVSASAGTGVTSHMTDRLAGTPWSTGGPQRGGEWIQIDLGAVVPVALIRWLPGTYQEVPRGLRLEVSSDGAAWRTLVELPRYLGPFYWSAGHPMRRVRSGRVELRVPPAPARYLRITQTGRDTLWAWTIRELYVYEASGEAPVPPIDVDGAELARAVQAAGVRQLYADHGWASRVAVAAPSVRILPANLQLDDYGFKGSASMLLPFFRWVPGTGVLLEPVDAEGFATAARAHGLVFTERRVGGLTVFVHAPSAEPMAPIPARALAVTASRHSERASLAVDGDAATRWSTAGPRATGDWFRVDLRAARVVRGLRIAASNPGDLPSSLAVEGSADGERWQRLPATIRSEHRLRWGGFGLLGDGATAIRIDVPPVSLTALRLLLSVGDPTFDWSIHELVLYGDG